MVNLLPFCCTLFFLQVNFGGRSNTSFLFDVICVRCRFRQGDRRLGVVTSRKLLIRSVARCFATRLCCYVQFYFLRFERLDLSFSFDLLPHLHAIRHCLLRNKHFLLFDSFFFAIVKVTFFNNLLPSCWNTTLLILTVLTQNLQFCVAFSEKFTKQHFLFTIFRASKFS